MENSRLFDWIDGIPDTETKKAEILEYYKEIQREFKKISKEDILKKLHMVDIIIDEECDCDKKTYPEYRMYVDGTSDTKVQGILKKAIDNFIEHGYYFFHYHNNQLQRELPEVVEKCLNNNNEKNEYWCRSLYDDEIETLSGKKAYKFIILCFSRIALETNITYNGKRHPFLDALRTEWSFDKVNDIKARKINYNELFRRTSCRREHFIYLYGDSFHTLSALKYENGEIYGSILALWVTKDKIFDELESNYDVVIRFKEEIKIEDASYRKIRKLIEITKNGLSLLMNDSGEIYAIGKMIDNPSCEYYKVCFDGFLKWTLYKNNEKFLCFENMIPKIPDKEIGIRNNDLKLFKQTFDIADTLKFEKIIQAAVAQKHGTIVVFVEDANTEVNRLEGSGIDIDPIDISTGRWVGEITSIDGAVICDTDGICYSIGMILDGTKSEKTDMSRGARYNSAIRYIEKQKKSEKRTFVVIVSEDGYVNCFSTIE